jgi:hypothetical protein
MKNKIKYFFCILACSISIIIHAQEYKLVSFSLNTGLNVFNQVKNSSDKVYDTDFISQTVNFETHFSPLKKHKNLGKIGVGFGVGFHHLTTDDPKFGWLWTNGDVGGYMLHIPLYLSLKYDFLKGEKFNPFVKIDNGFNWAFPSRSILIPGDRPYYYSYDGGYFFGVGTGIVVNKILNVGISYNIMNSYIACKYKWRGYWYNYRNDLKTSCLSVTIGFTL